MSFKRDGDDKSALNYQRKQRVAELLYEDIDEDEVMKLKNGKYTCKMCKHRPIFDTLNMFYVHKQGKKHIASLEYAAQQKQELEDLVMKRKHEEMAAQEATVSSAISCPRNPTVSFGEKRQKVGRFDRKKIVDLDSSSDVAMATKMEDLPGNRNHSAQKCQGYVRKGKDIFQGPGHVGNSHSSDNLKFQNNTSKFIPKNNSFAKDTGKMKFPSQYKIDEMLNLKNNEDVISGKDFGRIVHGIRTEEVNRSYLARKRQKQELADEIKKEMYQSQLGNMKNEECPQQTWQYYKNLKAGNVRLGKSRNVEVKTDSGAILGQSGSSLQNNQPVSLLQNSQSATLFQNNQPGTLLQINQSGTLLQNNQSGPLLHVGQSVSSIQINQPGSSLNNSQTNLTSGLRKNGSIKVTNRQQTMSQEGTASSDKKQTAEKMLQAFGSGWKKDWTGKWVRDEEAEFDSDDEPPDL